MTDNDQVSQAVDQLLLLAPYGIVLVALKHLAEALGSCQDDQQAAAAGAAAGRAAYLAGKNPRKS